eukprot:gnl/MRDRNA2_/MRDRNA2_167622_c0_seq1.p1 gnl/MRDRNA2_/MRDRNA2_167622_c0~~gnl/MRDRNA2_/MRDRNA2_167622_c0_seq1.p1  ORF type:complete len:115 (+),score=22.06 gnl/MRDRNA2_/MRDRNA2_167622_c0_seq1:3-347(+)
MVRNYNELESPPALQVFFAHEKAGRIALMEEPLYISDGKLLLGEKPLPMSLSSAGPINAGVWNVSVRWSHKKMTREEDSICSLIIYDDPDYVSDVQLQKYFTISFEDELLQQKE